MPFAAPDPGPVEHRVRVELVFPEPEPARWSWLTGWVKPWQALVALGAPSGITGRGAPIGRMIGT